MRALYLLTTILLLISSCWAPSSSRRQGNAEVVVNGLVSPHIQAYLDRLYDGGLLIPRHIYSFMETLHRSEHQRRLLNHLFEGGDNYSPRLLHLDRNEDASHMAIAIYKPDRDLSRWLVGRPGFGGEKRERTLEYRNGILLLELRSNEAPTVVGLVLFKNRATGNRIMHLEQMIPLEDIEQLHGIDNVLRVVEH